MTTVYCLFKTTTVETKEGAHRQFDELEGIYENANEAHDERKKRGGLRHVQFWKVK